ncbi:major facilitator superfamily domain-containing protein [Rhizoctonia solani]|nr:major facilitator superfamily domain-containing protein [Rhizoctonia solani]
MKLDNTVRVESDDGLDECNGTSGNDARCHQETTAQQRTPLPTKQVFVLCLMSFAEPVSLFVIFPFVNQMIEELGITSDPKKLGYYSGFIEGMFSFAQFFTVYFWGLLSDRIGRRPVLILGLCGVVGSTIMFGLSKSLPTMIVSRALSGILNGNSGLIKSVLGEITDETNQGAALAYFLLCWSLGWLLAPAIGGSLSHPAERYPAVFGFELFQRYPYLLPCLVASIFSTMGLVAGIFFLEETLPKSSASAERRPLLGSNPRTYSQSSTAPTTPPVSDPDHSQNARRPTSEDIGEHVPSVKEIIGNQYIRKIIISYAITTFVTVAISALMVLWLYTPVNIGGMGFSSAEIGTALVIAGLVGNIMSVIVFPPLERRVGALRVYRFSMVMLVATVLTFPLGHAFTITGGKKGAYLGASAMLGVRGLGGMVFVSNLLLINCSAPSRRSLGSINGIAQMAASASRGVGPVMATSLFAFSAQSNILGGNLIWLGLSAVALMGLVVACQIPNSRPLDAESQCRN